MFEARMQARISNFGRDMMEVCLGNFLHPAFKGSLLRYQNDTESYDKTLDFIKNKFKRSEAERGADPNASQDDIFASNPLDQGMDESGWGGLDMARAQVEAFESQQAESEPLEPIDRELTTWLKGTKLEKDVSLDILAFWRDQEARLPLLASLAKDILAMQMTSASSERVFSEGGHVVTKQRTLLNPGNAEMLIFVHDNYDQLEPFVKNWKTNIKEFTYEEREDMQLTSESEDDADEEEDRSLTPSQTLSRSQSQSQSQAQSQSQDKM